MALNLELNSERYIQLLEKLIGESEFLQNNPPRFIAQEDRFGPSHWLAWAALVPPILLSPSATLSACLLSVLDLNMP